MQIAIKSPINHTLKTSKVMVNGLFIYIGLFHVYQFLKAIYKTHTHTGDRDYHARYRLLIIRCGNHSHTLAPVSRLQASQKRF